MWRMSDKSGHGLRVVRTQHGVAGQANMETGRLKSFLFPLNYEIILQSEDEEIIEVEKAFNDGKADIDVCWNSRSDPCTKNAKYRNSEMNCFT